MKIVSIERQKKLEDKKYTDEDITSSLELIATTRNCNECKIRNCKWGTCNCSQITANAALDLINRQQAEIERLKKKVEELSDVLSDSIRIRYKEAQSEAIKEFAESLNEKVENARKKYQRLCREQGEKEDEAMNIHFKGIIKLVNNLVKEKVG